jgi:multisubunit Na+/H+ antiporter MnhC subunit
MWDFRTIARFQFSTLALGLLSPIIIGMGLGLHSLPGLDVTPPTWVLLGTLFVGPIVGSTLHFVTRRVIYMKAYTVAVYAAYSLVYGSLVWNVLSLGMTRGSRLLMGLAIGVALMAVGWQAYIMSLNSPERAVMPHGEMGMLDEETGLVDPLLFTPAIKRREAEHHRLRALWRVPLALAPALSLWLVRALPVTGDLILTLVVASFFVTAFMVIVGKQSSYVLASRHWEREHGKHLCVKR